MAKIHVTRAMLLLRAAAHTVHLMLHYVHASFNEPYFVLSGPCGAAMRSAQVREHIYTHTQVMCKHIEARIQYAERRHTRTISYSIYIHTHILRMVVAQIRWLKYVTLCICFNPYLHRSS